MNNLRYLFLAFLALTFGCFSVGSKPGKTVVDTCNRTITIPENVNRIVCCGPGALRLITYMNATDRVVGVEDFEKRHREGKPYLLAHRKLLSLPSIGQGGPGKLPNLEAIIKLKPDVIFLSYVSKSTADMIERKTGIPTVVLSYGKSATFYERDVFKSLSIVGKVLNKQKRAEQVENFIESIENDLRHRGRKPCKLTIYVGGVGQRGVHGIESTIADYPPFRFLNLKNVASNLKAKGHVFIDKEQLLAWNPNVIFLDEGGLSLIKANYMRNIKFYNSLKAFKKGKVYGLLPYNFYATNIGTALADAYYIGKIMYPEAFKDVDVEETSNRIYSFLVGKPLYEELKKEWGGFGKLNMSLVKPVLSLPKKP